MADDGPWSGPVVVPDDLRELRDDVAAYHREQRLARRRRRWQRITGGRAWRALSVPVGLAVFLATLSGGMVALLLLGQPTVRPAPGPVAVPSGAPRELLANELVSYGGQPTPVRSLRPALLALVPQPCNCTDLLESLAAQADEVRMPLVVVAPAATDAEVAALDGQLHHGNVEPVFDSTGALARDYRASGVTAVVVGRDATVEYVAMNVTTATRLELPLQKAAAPATAK